MAICSHFILDRGFLGRYGYGKDKVQDKTTRRNQTRHHHVEVRPAICTGQTMDRRSIVVNRLDAARWQLRGPIPVQGTVI
jgi:hypothetical protein